MAVVLAEGEHVETELVGGARIGERGVEPVDGRDRPTRVQVGREVAERDDPELHAVTSPCRPGPRRSRPGWAWASGPRAVRCGQTAYRTSRPDRRRRTRAWTGCTGLGSRPPACVPRLRCRRSCGRGPACRRAWVRAPPGAAT